MDAGGTGLMLVSAPAMAKDWTYVSSLGDEYAVAANENGVVLTPLYPKAWFIESGANSTIEKGQDVIFWTGPAMLFSPAMLFTSCLATENGCKQTARFW